jgi:hypothetical protein
MKTNKFFIAVLLLSLAIVLPSSMKAQDCRFFYPTEAGTTLEYTFYNKKGNEESYQTQTVVAARETGGATIVEIEATSRTGKKKDGEVKTNFEVKCEDGKFYINMNDFTSSANYEQYEGSPDMDVKIDADALYYPSDLSVGQTLPEGNIEISVEARGMKMFGTTITIKDRKVEATETITTDAGTFDCLKISSVVITKSVMKMETKTVQWLAEGVGIVKTENLSDKGKVIGSQVLTGIKK